MRADKKATRPGWRLRFGMRTLVLAMLLCGAFFGGWAANERMHRRRLEAERSKMDLTAMRRLMLDLTGLPPTVGEVRAFLADDRPDAHERLLARLLHGGPAPSRGGPSARSSGESDGWDR